MNLGQLRGLTLQWLDDLEAGYFTPTQVNLWLNNAQKEAQKRLLQAGQNYYLICKETTFTINQQEYVLPSDFRKLHRLEVIVSGWGTINESKYMVSPMTLNQEDLVNLTPGDPAFYVLKKSRVKVFPAPSVGYHVRLFYSYLVEDMVVDTDVPDVPEAYHEYLACLATQDGFMRDGRVPDLILKKIAEYEKQMDQDANERLVDQPRQIVETGENAQHGQFFW